MAILNVKGLPDPIYEKLKGRARLHHRSVAQEVTAILGDAVREPETLSILELRGLGKQLWQGVDADRHVDAERDAWT